MRQRISYVVESRNSRSRTHISGHETIKLKAEDFQPEPKKQGTTRSFQTRLNTAIDYSKQSPFFRGVPNAEEIISHRMGLPTRQEVQQRLLQQHEVHRRTNFLPLEFYNLDDEDFRPELLLQKYRDPETGTLAAHSKWFGTDNSFTWKPCTVLGFDDQDERYLIRWNDSQKEKKVSRVNLRFDQ